MHPRWTRSLRSYISNKILQYSRLTLTDCGIIYHYILATWPAEKGNTTVNDPVAKERRSFLGLACKVSSAYVTNNSVTATDLPRLIAGVHGVFYELANAAVSEEVPTQNPAVSIRKSVTLDFLICLECGQKLKALKRHLVRHDLSPAGYRAKWQLPLGYPMVAANYTATRSRIARDLGLGRRPRPRPADISATSA